LFEEVDIGLGEVVGRAAVGRAVIHRDIIAHRRR
jgi:hypothetical protein